MFSLLCSDSSGNNSQEVIHLSSERYTCICGCEFLVLVDFILVRVMMLHSHSTI